MANNLLAAAGVKHHPGLHMETCYWLVGGDPVPVCIGIRQSSMQIEVYLWLIGRRYVNAACEPVLARMRVLPPALIAEAKRLLEIKEEVR